MSMLGEKLTFMKTKVEPLIWMDSMEDILEDHKEQASPIVGYF